MAQPYWRGYYIEADPEDPDSPNGLVRNLQLHNVHLQDNSIAGHGHHQQLGEFVIEGACKNGDLDFKLKCANGRELIFSGVREGNTLQGAWGNDPEYDVGSWKFTRVTPKLGWNGAYQQGNIDYDMDFKQLTIENGHVHATGSDENGDFTITGTHDPTTQKVSLEKAYENGISWKYWGNVSGNVIEGSWGDEEGEGMGSFRLYKI